MDCHVVHACRVAVLLAVAAAGCESRERESPGETVDEARGRELLGRMSQVLAAAPTVRVTTTEARSRVRAAGDTVRETLNRDVVLRRPDRLHFKASGGAEMEGWYDGRRLILASHRDRVFAEAPMPATLDETFDVITQRYGMPMPMADLFYSSPTAALLSGTTTGGFMGRTKLDGVNADHLGFREAAVEWDLWLPARGDPLPLRMRIVRRSDARESVADVRFTKWDLTPQAGDSLFAARVPGDYEGIAMIQRAEAVMPSGTDSAGTGTDSAPSGTGARKGTRPPR
jgi:hypothetical protein